MASPVGATFLIDVSTRGDLGTADGAEAAVSDDGRQVAFVSDWDELVPDDGNGFPDVFMQDRLRGTVSRLTTAFDGSDADGGSRAPSIDVAGEVVAFESDASNLATGDGNGVSDIFVWMADSKMLTRVSVNSLGEEAHAPSRRPHVAGSGTIVFESLAANLTSRDDNSTWDVFARDTGAGVTELISASPLGDSGDAPSKGGTVSTDGRYVAFSSEAADLVPGDDNGVSDVFVRDRHLGVTIRASCDELGTPLGGPSWGADLSDDGRFVAFTTMRAAKDGDGRLIVVVKDLVSGALLIASQTAEGDIAEADSSETCISADGRFVAFETQADSLGWVGGASRVLRKDMWTGELTLISRSTNDLAPLDVEFSSRRPAISGDGRFVGFDSDFAMIPGLEGGHHVYLRDTNPVLSPWTDLQGASGTGWGEPRLSGAGLLAADSEARLDVVNAPPTSLGIILVATDSMPVPFHGGLLAAHPIDLLLPFTTDSNGRFVTTFRWPAAVRAGEIFVFQSLVRATASAEVLAVSNALKATAP
jgi:Tol biopolymer transport system component